jgi:hypothetical protein
MSSISPIVNVSITAESQTVTRAGFGTILIMSCEAKAVQGPTAVRYESVDEMVLAGFSASGKTVKMATRAFQQAPAVNAVVVGKRNTLPTVTATLTPIVKNNTGYSVTINDEVFTFNSGSEATAASIVSGLVALINAGGQNVLASGSATLVITGADAPGGTGTPGSLFTVTGYNRALFSMQDTTADAGIAADLVTIRTAVDGSDDWYAVAIDTHGKAEILALAASSSVQTGFKAFWYSTPDADCLTGSATSVMGEAKSAGLAKVKGLFHTQAAAYAPEMAWAGLIMASDPGSTALPHKTLRGVPVDVLTSAEVNNVLSLNGGTYTEIGGQGRTRGQKDALGEDMEVQRFIAFLTARMQENVFALLASRKKVPFTAGGLAQIESVINSTLLLGVRVGGLAPLPAYKISMPPVSSFTPAQRAAGELTGITFEATFAAAIYYVGITGTLLF